ncbi:Selenoprotein H [Galemys pyrenaicus]|uniref:Selenoprotein H n=1 Tax=Galemys pyrenaicus TaxID=202257 RepID=A0A8J6A384_GALPY|nr:Selenoprotein H [Galemys pyrenaicus]
MAPRGRKRKAEAASVAEAEKREKPAVDQEGEAAAAVALSREAPELPVRVNPAKPRRGSFEVTLLRPDGSSAELWTRIKKGPPRKLKFPEPLEVVEQLKKYLS